MTQNEISLLVYLESQLVTRQGFINQNDLRVADFRTLKEWENQGKCTVKQLKQPNGIANPQFTHRIRLTDKMMEKAWLARYSKAAQFTPPLKEIDEEGNEVKTGDVNSPLEGSLRLVGGGVSDEPDTEESPESKNEMYTGYLAFLEAHNNAATPAQAQLAEQIFEVFEKKQHRYFINGKATGKSWLLKTIDQYITSITKPKNSN